MPLDSGFKKAEDSPGFLLWKASNRLQRLHAQCLEGLPVTPTQFSLMACLVYLSGKGPVTATSIVQHAGMDKMMVSDLLKALEKKKLVQRKLNPDDGRSALIVPTTAGIQATNSAVLKVEAFDTEFFKGVVDLKTFQANLAALATEG